MDAALGPFAEAATAIEAAESRREDRIAAVEAQLERKLAELDRQRAAKVAECERHVEQVRADAEMEIAEWRSVLATSVAQIRSCEVGVADTAALLGISAKAVTALSRQAPDAAPVGTMAAEPESDDEGSATAPVDTAAAAELEPTVADGVAVLDAAEEPGPVGEAAEWSGEETD